MSVTQHDIWRPDPEQIEHANVTALAEKLGVDSYDDLYRVSIERPDLYWRAMVDFSRIRWSRPYEQFVDLSRGAPFPRWFVGGELNWTDTVFAWCAHPETAARTAVIAETEDGSVAQVTYAGLQSRVDGFAAGLRRLGLQRGDRVGLLMESGIEATVTFLALSHMGAIVVPLFSGFGHDAIVSRLTACGARAIVTTAGFHRRGRLVDVTAVMQEVMRRVPTVEHLVVKPVGGRSATMSGAVDWRSVEATEPDGIPPARMASDDPFMIIYTSGTTGRPKGTVHTHGGFPLKIAGDAAIHFDVHAGDVFCWPADMGWVAGALIISSALLHGATLVCYDGAPDFPDWSRMSRLIERYKITQFGSAPTLIRGLAANAALATRGDMSSVRLLITSGETIDPEHFSWHQAAFGRGRAPLINFTGGTEASGGLLSSVLVRPIVPSGFNTASPGVAVDVVDAAGRPVVDQVGELAILAPFVGMTQSFWQDDERYLDTYWRALPGKWLHGDLAIRTSSGGFFLRGRSDDTIKVAGKRLGPAEVEEVLTELPAVSEAAAIGVDDPVKGQKLVVFVIAAGGNAAETDLPGLIGRHVEARLGKPFRPSAVHLVSQLPKTRSSKVMRRVIRSAYSGLPLGDLSALDNPSALEEIGKLREPGR